MATSRGNLYRPRFTFVCVFARALCRGVVPLISNKCRNCIHLRRAECVLAGAPLWKDTFRRVLALGARSGCVRRQNVVEGGKIALETGQLEASSTPTIAGDVLGAFGWACWLYSGCHLRGAGALWVSGLKADIRKACLVAKYLPCAPVKSDTILKHSSAARLMAPLQVQGLCLLRAIRGKCGMYS